MALDGIFLSRVKDEITQRVLQFRVEKVQQPTKDEIVLVFRGKGGAHRLLICVRSDSPRVHFTTQTIENPAAPPMFCMLLRKYLTAAKLTAVRQRELDRILFLDFDATNEIGDPTKLTLCVEIMGTYSNLILIGENGEIIDSVKRIDYAASAVRQVLPGLPYVLPQAQDKLCLETATPQQVLERLSLTPHKLLSGAILNAVQGISPIVARELAFRVGGEDLTPAELDAAQTKRLSDVLQQIRDGLHRDTAVYMVLDENEQPKELSFLDIFQYATARQVRTFDSASALLDAFFSERDRVSRLHQRGKELLRTLSNLTERTARKLSMQQKELAACADRETLKLYGELITANLHRLQKGSRVYDVENYYDNMQVLHIPADPAKTPLENATRYYKEYRKSKTAEVMLTKLIAEGEAELAYFESVQEALSRADSDAELSAIREELHGGGYIKKSGKKGKQKPLDFLRFRSTDGYSILVGRNNLQNDRLSMKLANNNDMWLHTQGFPGSHVVIENQSGEVSDQSIEEAASLAAYYSKARESSRVAVDYTRVRELKKPVGAKPGKVIYHTYYTILAKPDKALAERLKAEN